MNQRNLPKHAKVVRENKINTNFKNTEQIVKKMLNIDEPATGP